MPGEAGELWGLKDPDENGLVATGENALAPKGVLTPGLAPGLNLHVDGGEVIKGRRAWGVRGVAYFYMQLNQSYSPTARAIQKFNLPPQPGVFIGRLPSTVQVSAKGTVGAKSRAARQTHAVFEGPPPRYHHNSHQHHTTISLPTSDRASATSGLHTYVQHFAALLLPQANASKKTQRQLPHKKKKKFPPNHTNT